MSAVTVRDSLIILQSALDRAFGHAANDVFLEDGVENQLRNNDHDARRVDAAVVDRIFPLEHGGHQGNRIFASVRYERNRKRELVPDIDDVENGHRDKHGFHDGSHNGETQPIQSASVHDRRLFDFLGKTAQKSDEQKRIERYGKRDVRNDQAKIGIEGVEYNIHPVNWKDQNINGHRQTQQKIHVKPVRSSPVLESHPADGKRAHERKQQAENLRTDDDDEGVPVHQGKIQNFERPCVIIESKAFRPGKRHIHDFVVRFERKQQHPQKRHDNHES